jgi:hypothetical protein
MYKTNGLKDLGIYAQTCHGLNCCKYFKFLNKYYNKSWQSWI